MHFKRSIAIGTAIIAMAVGCGGSSPRPNTTATAPPIPAGVVPLGEITWTTVTVPGGIPEGTQFSEAAAGPKGFVVVGDTGALAFQGVVVRSTDGRSWEAVHEPDIAPWGLSNVIATEAGFVAVGGAFSGEQSWKSAMLTSADGSDWTVRQTFDEVSILSLASRGSITVATTDAASLVVSRDAGKTWHQILATAAGFGTGSPSAVAILSSGRWVAVGTMGTSAAAWTSADGLAWEPATIEAADPVPGIKSVSPYAIAVGASVAVATGTDDPAECTEGDDFCGSYGAGWTTVDGSHWMRLPRNTPLTTSFGDRVYGAGPAGVVSILPDLAQSPNGWTWITVAGKNGSLPFGAFAIRDRTVVAAGMIISGDSPSEAIWVGSIAGP